MVLGLAPELSTKRALLLDMYRLKLWDENSVFAF